MPLYLCLDQGGHASRALVLDERGEVISRAVRAVATHAPAPDCVEQDPRELVASVLDAAQATVDGLGTRADELAAAGLATQRSSIVCWDRETGAALSPVISWQDRRAHVALASLAPQAADIEQRSGLRLSAHYGASKLRWCLDHLDAVRVAHRENRLAIGPLSSFLVFQLLEQRPCMVDPSNGQRTLLWSLAMRDWDASLLEQFGIPRAVLPACVSTRRAFGTLRLRNGALPMMIVTGDQAAALFAFGAPREDAAYVNLGTGAFAQRVMREPFRASGLLTGMAFHDNSRTVFTLEGTVNGAGSALAWAGQYLALTDIDAQLSGWLERTPEPPLFLNGIGGLGAPYWVTDFPSHFIGDGEPWQKAAAVAESIVFLLTVNLERMQLVAGRPATLVLSGGLALCDALCQRLADLTGLPIWRPDEHEASARGLAWLLADCPAHWFSEEGVSFSPAVQPRLHDRYKRWRLAMEAAMR